MIDDIQRVEHYSLILEVQMSCWFSVSCKCPFSHCTVVDVERMTNQNPINLGFVSSDLSFTPHFSDLNS